MEINDFSQLRSLVPKMKIISESEYRLIGFSEEQSLVYHEWLDDSQDIDDDAFKSETLELFRVLERLRPAYFIVNDKKRKTSISSEINEFLVVNFQPIYSHMKKVALVSNEKLSIQSQAESTMEDVKNVSESTGAEFNFFIDVRQAVDWIGLHIES
jgi:hypothetical protein